MRRVCSGKGSKWALGIGHWTQQTFWKFLKTAENQKLGGIKSKIRNILRKLRSHVTAGSTGQGRIEE